MTTKKHGRGRPEGSGKNDRPTLDRVADSIVKEAHLKPTTAMLRVIRSREGWDSTEPTLLRRLQGKWKKDSVALLSAARERAARASASAKSVNIGDVLASQSVIERTQRWLDSPVGRAAMGQIYSPAFQKLLGHVTSPGYQAELTRVEKVARGMMESPVLERMLELQRNAETSLGLNKGGRGLV